MELSPIMDDLESASGQSGYPSQALNAEPPLDSSYGNHTIVSIEAVLSDMSERSHFRDYSEQEGLLGYFKFFQAVEDLHRCAHAQSVKSMTGDINSQYLESGGQHYIELHSDTLYKTRNQIDFGDDPKGVFDIAQQEAIATLKLLVYRTYMMERHQMKYNLDLPPVDDTFVLRESPLYLSILRMLGCTTDRLRLVAMAEEVNASGWIDFIACVEAFRELEPEDMPQEAHSIVEKFLATDSGLELKFSNKVHQELINTVQPNQSMFDRALREAFHAFVHALCLESPASLIQQGY
jgi:hypothetical protein